MADSLRGAAAHVIDPYITSYLDTNNILCHIISLGINLFVTFSYGYNFKIKNSFMHF